MKIKILEKSPQADLKVELEHSIWDKERLISQVRKALLLVAEEFYSTLDIDAGLEDVRFTGSLANFNYTPKSDIDLHLVIDFSKVDENSQLVKNYFDAKRVLWNKKHAITVKGYEVEVYVENVGEKHISTGIYSISNDEWIVKPTQVKEDVDLETANKKAEMIKKEIQSAVSSEDNLEHLQKIKEKIKKMRQCGLEKGGIFSAENIAFKTLRNDGDIDRLSSAITKEYDRQHSLPEEVHKT
jgi:hypothetical protein